MLATLDVLIATVVILLGVSLIVTMVNQALASAMAVRGRNLRWGLAMLIQELHSDAKLDTDGVDFARPPGATPLFGKDIKQSVSDAVDRVLKHPLVSDSKAPLKWWGLSSTIRFDEFIKTILLLGKPDPPTAARADESKLERRSREAQNALNWLRENHRITEPWFNSVMDRVSQRFTMHMRFYSVAVSFAVVAILGMDTLFIVNTLRTDTALRTAFVAVGSDLAQTNTLDPDARVALSSLAKTASAKLSEDQDVSKLFFKASVASIPGMLLSVLLLSLGAPFWFTVLKNLVSLRSIVAKKESQERTASVPDVGDQIRVRSF